MMADNVSSTHSVDFLKKIKKIEHCKREINGAGVFHFNRTLRLEAFLKFIKVVFVAILIISVNVCYEFHAKIFLIGIKNNEKYL